MLTRKALWIPIAASVGLLVVLGVAGWSIDSSPVSSPASSSQNTSTTQSVSIVPTPDVAEITVKTTTSTTTTTTTTRTTQPKPPPVQPPPPVQQPTTTTEPPQRGLLVIENATCGPEGARGIGLRDEPLVCRKDPDRGNRLRWQRA
ncbi:hypothetical protein SAMN05216188_101441 [Lentzea xinjiangensis]|uniref:Uncharacterized protein n=1 Tax=Lentzea xinjiangensis TaxID=402600 RepID=A0A1H9AKK6_9PSEU|nr:hypothetical protein [Lentzea xinjiangensis]SEP77294.1 hypothetical protein SAMN05216188_101441 [Lentzea xinjiangensis]